MKSNTMSTLRGVMLAPLVRAWMRDTVRVSVRMRCGVSIVNARRLGQGTVLISASIAIIVFDAHAVYGFDGIVTKYTVIRLAESRPLLA